MGWGKRLRQLRERAGLTQAQASDRAGISPRTWENWESGHRVPDTAWLVSLADVLAASLDELLRNLGEPDAPRPPGRPRKAPDGSPAPDQPKRPRGRPPKQQAAEQTTPAKKGRMPKGGKSGVGG
jgi:transcriptional regulator with XRE-family HTH domain